jgi:hypothetical protein
MKTHTKAFVPEVLSNPISRNLILILISALFIAAGIVTASVMLYDHW